MDTPKLFLILMVYFVGFCVTLEWDRWNDEDLLRFASYIFDSLILYRCRGKDSIDNTDNLVVTFSIIDYVYCFVKKKEVFIRI